jgi:hypothetical protein
MVTVPKVRLVGDSFASVLDQAICELLAVLCAIGDLAVRAPVCPVLRVKPRLPKERSAPGV